MRRMATLLLFALGVAVLSAWAAAAVMVVRGVSRVRALGAVTEPYAPWRPAEAPAVSAIVPARDEAAALERAIRSLLAQDYPALEVIAVDDRSSDETPAILARLAAEDARLTVVRVDRLPMAEDGTPAWLGKSYALARGAERARGEWLLFCDADVEHDPTVVSRAVRVAVRDGREHLTLLPRVEPSGTLQRAFLGAFGLALLLARRVWDVPDPKSRASVGVGAFNLVHRAIYSRFGGHAALRLEVIDDMALAQEAKRAGGRSEALFADGLVRLRWYPSVRAMVEGFTKNAFAAVGFSLPAAVGAVTVQALLGLGPYLGALFAPGIARVPYLLAVAGITAGFGIYGRREPEQARLSDAVLFPVAVLLLMASFARSTWATLARGGVEWRGTRYPLARLREGSRFRA
ncbi:MAG TPA: glycosyltransferase [Thermodesulfobacteriota bacterium]